MIFDTFHPTLIIFDKDGTLLDFDYLWGNWAYNIGTRLEEASDKKIMGRFAHDWGFDPETKHVYANEELADRTLAELHDLTHDLLQREGFSGEAASRILAAAWHLPDSMSLIKPIINLESLFTYLRSLNIKIAVATLDNRAPTQTTFAHLGVLKYVDALICADDGVPLKPAPDMIYHVCQELNCEPKRCMMIGDSVSDLQMGRAAGVGYTVGVLTGLNPAEKLKPYADHIINSIQELIVEPS